MTSMKGAMSVIHPQRAWKAVLEHDHRFDGIFVYAVSSTTVYCRPSCPSRRPRRHRVQFFASPQLAEAAGFRACRRCEPRSIYSSRGERMVHHVRRHLDGNPDEPATLSRLAGLTGMSPFHLQRAFTRTIGISPKAYRNAARLDRFQQALRCGSTVTEATYEAGFGSSSRVYEQASKYLGMTPSAFRSGGTGVTLRYATVQTPVGLAQIARTARGVSSVMLGESASDLLVQLQREYPNAVLCHDPRRLAKYKEILVRCLNGSARMGNILIDVNATAFQLKVWQALQQIPSGSTRTYREIASVIGHPAASRAVARACASNPVALLIPCHRVVGADGRLAGYRWGLHRKHALLGLEASGRRSIQQAASRADQSVKARSRSATERTPIIVPSAVTGK